MGSILMINQAFVNLFPIETLPVSFDAFHRLCHMTFGAHINVDKVRVYNYYIAMSLQNFMVVPGDVPS